MNFANRQTDGISGTDLQTPSVPASTSAADTSAEECSGTPNDTFKWGKSSMERRYPSQDGKHIGVPSGFLHRNISLPLNLNTRPNDVDIIESQSGDHFPDEMPSDQTDRKWIGHGLRITRKDFTTGPLANLFN